MLRLLLTILFAGIFLTATPAQAEIQTYEGIGEYFMEDETIDDAKNQAELEAQRNALERASVYVKAHSESIDWELTEDEIITITAGILHVIDTKFSFTNEAGLVKIKAFVTAQIDTAELEELLKHEMKARMSKG